MTLCQTREVETFARFWLHHGCRERTQSGRKRRHRFRLAVHQRHGGTFLELAVPIEQTRLSGMSRQTADGVDVRGHANGFAPELHAGCAVHDLASERATRLKAGKNDVALFAPEIVLEVMADAPAVAHAAAGDDNGPAAHAVDGHGLGRGAAE